MFCRNCGKEVNDNAVVCIHCGCSIKNEDGDTLSKGGSKTAIGALFGIFLGLIGLIIGLILYKDGSLERKSFVKGWGIAFGISVGLVILIYIFAFGLLSSLYLYY